MNSNWWGAVPWTQQDDNNVLMQNGRKLWVAVLGQSDTFATAQDVQVSAASMYAPFIKVSYNGTDPIKSVCVVQDAGVEAGAPFSFFDPYSVVPEPCTLLLAGMSLLGLVRRRR